MGSVNADDRQPGSTSAQKQSRRAKIACKSCNARRVKCDVTVSQPCWHCRVRQKPCELIESRRGRYPRVHQRMNTSRHAEGNGPTEQPEPRKDSSASVPFQQPPAQRPHDAMSAGSPDMIQQISTPISIADSGEKSDEPASVDGPEMLFARMAEVQPDHDSRSDQGRMLFLGEAFTLAFVVKTVCSPSDGTSEIRNHYPIPVSVPDRLDRRDESAKAFSQQEEAFLSAQGAFELPEKELSDDLVAVFFRYFHPAWPIFDRRHFVTKYERGQASPLVLQTIYFIAVSICDEELLYRTGFTDRYQARRVFYLRAKGLYDADYEKDKVILAAVLFLFCFWWQGPEDQKDTWHWVGCALSLAQTLGMHRSTARSGIDPRQRSLWKRIFWCIYARDRHAAAALGRPFRIHDEDCDVEELSEEDFEFDIAPESVIMPPQQSWHVQYSIAMSKLAIIFGKIIFSRFAPQKSRNELDAQPLGRELANWKEKLPKEMLLQDIADSCEAGFWAAMLHSNAYTCQILLFRPSRVVVESKEEIQNDAIARAAADALTRIAEDLLTSGTLRVAQIHLAPALFAACGMHAIVVRRKSAIHSQVAENRARQCMLALNELAKSWPVAGWILRLFISLMRRLTGHDFDVDPKWSVPMESVAVPNPPRLRANDIVLRQEQQNPQNLPNGLGFQPDPSTPMATQDSANCWSNDLMSEDLDWIFKDSLGGFSLYDLGLSSEHESVAL